MTRPTARVAWLAVLALCALLPTPASAQDNPVSISVEAPSTPVAAGSTVTLPLRFEIEKPYHLYAPNSPGDFIIRTAVSIAEDDEAFTLVETRFPDIAEELVVDYGTGEVERFLVMGGVFTVEVDVAIAASAAGEVSGALLVNSQACDDASCLPPQYDEPIAFKLTVIPATGGDDVALGNTVSREISDGPVTVTTSSLATVPPGATSTLRVAFDIESPYHVYTSDSDNGPMLDPIRTRVSVTSPVDGVTIGAANYPKDIDHDLTVEYGQFGEETYQVWSGEFDITVPITLAADVSGDVPLEVTVEFQACDEVCYPPVEEMFTLNVTAGGEPSRDQLAVNARGSAEPPTSSDDVDATESSETETNASSASGPSDDIESRLLSALGEGNLISVIGLSMLAALFALLTPCVFPMIPITVSFFTKRAEATGGKGATKYALAYGGGIIGTYTGFGLLLALVSAGAAASFATNPWVNIAVGVLFVFFGLSLLGFYDLQPPAFLTNMAQGKGDSSADSGYMPVMAMGFVFTITAFTCTAPVVGTLLAGFSTADSPLLIVIGMLSFSTMFALPFVLLAMFPNALSSLPSAGGWMLTVKAAMGFIELVAALKFFSNADIVWGLELMPRPTMLLAAIMLMAALALYLYGTYKLPHDYEAPKLSFKGGRGVSALLVTALVLFLSTGMTGKSLGGALESYLPPSDYGVADDQKQKSNVPWIGDFDAALAESRATGKPVFVDFTGVTCVNCRIVEKSVFELPEFAALSKDVVFAKLYTDRRTDEHRAGDEANKDLMSARFSTVTLPLYALVKPKGDDDFEIVRRMSMPKPDAIAVETFERFVAE